MKTPSTRPRPKLQSQPKNKNKKTTKPQSKLSDKQRQEQQQTVSAGLAICLLGSNKYKMFDSEYEEEIRKQAVMQVSPFSSLHFSGLSVYFCSYPPLLIFLAYFPLLRALCAELVCPRLSVLSFSPLILCRLTRLPSSSASKEPLNPS